MLHERQRLVFCRCVSAAAAADPSPAAAPDSTLAAAPARPDVNLALLQGRRCYLPSSTASTSSLSSCRRSCTASLTCKSILNAFQYMHTPNYMLHRRDWG